MNMKSLILVSLFALSGLFAAWYPKVNFAEKESMILDAVVRFLDAYHFSPKTIDDSFSKQTYDLYLDYIDNGKRFLTEVEIKELEAYKTQIDDQVNLRTTGFFDLSMEKIEYGHTRAKAIFGKLIETDIPLQSERMIEMDSDKRSFVKNDTELEQFWKDMLSYDLIDRIKDIQEAQQDSVTKLSFDEIKSKSTKEMKESYEDWFTRLEKTKRSDYFETFVNTLTHVYDPHSDYFNPKEKEDFDIRMGGKLKGIGARLVADGEYTKVSEIIAGGPAWKGKELLANDLIMKVRQKGEDEPVNIQGMRVDEVVTYIRGEPGTIVFLTVKSTDGTVKVIEIERDEVIIDEGFAKSLILDIPEVSDNIGYIKLPRFYDSFEGKVGNSCAKDVAAEVEKLKANNVNGIILDLRNNGGGSLRDVVTMSGLFIEEGPIVQVKPRNKDAFLYSDKDDDVQYTGPLIVMVNEFSASASEILAAAVQDYKRAIVVGSKSTFGKGTVQRFVDLDEAFRGDDKFKPLGNLKISMQKFYRVNGGSTQLKGVIPDIILPDNYHYIETGEKDYDYAMDWSEIDKVDYGQDTYVIDNMDYYVTNSAARIAGNENFQMVLENAKRLKEMRDDSNYPLDLDAFEAKMDARKKAADKFENLYDVDIESLAIKNLEQDKVALAEDESKQARNEEWIKGVQKDFYIEEVMYIMKDLISNH